MAVAEVVTHIVNPARRKNMAKRKLTDKQIKFFGTKRQRAALKTKRRHAPARRTNSAPRRRAAPKHHRRRTLKTNKARRRSNPMEIISFLPGNPAKRRSNMAKTPKHRKLKKSNAARHRSAGRPAPRITRRRPNPGSIGRPMDWIKGGVGVLGGVIVTRALPQAVASTYNTGAVGYGMNAITAVLAAWGTHAVTKDPVLTASVAAGGFAALIARMISDMTSFGQYLSLTGIGDYMVSNFVSPQRIVNQRQALLEVPGGGWGGAAGGYQAYAGSVGVPTTDQPRADEY